jgi:hypothetical protein
MNNHICENLNDFETNIETIEIERNINIADLTDIANKEIALKTAIKTAIELLELEEIAVYSRVGTLLSTDCPCCTNKKFKTKNDTLIKVEKATNSKNFKINIISSNKTCRNEEHKLFFEKFKAEYIEMLPDHEILESLQLIEDIKENIDITALNDLNESLLLADTLRIVGTGGHKTFQSARKFIENVFVNNIFHIHSTKENKAIKDFEREIKHVLSLVMFKRTSRIDKFLENEKIGLKEIGIHKLINVNPISAKKIRHLIGVVTNHKYFYCNGHLSDYNKNMLKLVEHCKSVKTEIVIDEYESFKTQGQMSIRLNKYQNYRYDYDNKEIKIFGNAKTCLYPAISTVISKENMSPFEFAVEYTKQTLKAGDNGIYEYQMDINGNMDLEYTMSISCNRTNSIRYDTGRRRPKCIKKGNFEYGYCIVEKMQEYELKNDITDEDLEKSNFLRLLTKSCYITKVSQIIATGQVLKKDDPFDIDCWGTKLFNLEDLKNFGEELEEKTDISFENFKKQLYEEHGSELFIEYLVVRIPSSLKFFDCTKYYLTGNIIKDNKIVVDTTLAHKSSDKLKTIDIAVVEIERKGDKKLLKALKYLKHSKFKTIAFTSLASNINDMINNGYDTSYMRIRTSINAENQEKSKTISYNTNDNEEIIDNEKTTVTVTHINSPESQGRNYSQAEYFVINATAQVNAVGRIYEDENKKVEFRSIEDETILRVKQCIGRIMRGEQEFKAGIIFAKNFEGVKEIFDSYPDNFSIHFNIVKYEKQFDNEIGTLHAVNDIINYHTYKLGYSEEVQHFNSDKRKLGNTKKYDEIEIYKFYINKVEEYYQKNKKKLKDTEIIPEIIEKFGISEKQFKRIKSKLKE